MDFEAVLEQFILNINYNFESIETLESTLIEFYHRFIDANAEFEGYAFPAPPSALLPASFFAQVGKIKEKFNLMIYNCIQHSHPQLNKENKGKIFIAMTQEDALLYHLVQMLKLRDIDFIPADNPLYENLLSNLALFLSHAVIVDSQNKPQNGLTWIASFIGNFQTRTQLTASSFNYYPKPVFYNNQDKETDFRNVESFETKVLLQITNGLNAPVPLPELAASFELETSNNYYQQFLPYILEETRASIASQIQLIQKRTLPFFKVTLERDAGASNDFPVVGCHCYTNHLPKLDHSFAMEAIILRIVQKHPRQAAVEVFGIATNVYFDKKKRQHKLMIIVLAPYVMMNASMFKAGTVWQANWLAGLISYSRMYDACLTQTPTNFEEQYITGNLQTWPAMDQLAVVQSFSVKNNLNAAQYQAVAQFHHAEEGLYLLQGPPGTGKTTTIIHLLRLLAVEKSQRILVCAPSNKAVRLLADRFYDLVGDTVSMVLTGVAKELSEKLKGIFINETAEIICDEIGFLRKELQNINGLVNATMNGRLNHAKPRPDDCKNIAANIKELIIRCQNLLNQCLAATEFPLDWRAKDTLKTLQRFHQEQSAKITELAEIYDSKYADFVVREANGEFNAFPSLQQAAIVKRTQTNIAEVGANLTYTYQTLEDLLMAYQENMGKCSEAIEILLLQHAQVIFCTLVSSGRKWLGKYIHSVDTLIIDEAAQAVEPEILIPFKFSPKKCLQVGDTRQLPATVLSKGAQDNDFGRSMMFRLIEVCEQTYKILEQQYRMHPAICRWPSERHYAGRLQTADELIARTSPLSETNINPLLLTPCLFFNVKGREDRRSGVSASIKSTDEVNAIIDLVWQLLPYLEGNQIGIITFYAAQADLLRTKLTEKTKTSSEIIREKSKQLMISTVDGFQGEEKDVIIISAVRSSESVGFLRDGRRINVAVTRAKHHLYFFGHRVALENSNSDIADLIPDYARRPNTECQLIDYETFKRFQ